MTDLSPSITDLAAQIQAATALVQDHLQQNSLPPLSLSQDSFPFFPGTGPCAIDPFPAPPSSILKARSDVISACETLLQLMITPADHLIWNLGCSYHASAALQYIYHFKIAEAVAVDGETSYEEITAKTGLDEKKLRRVLRMAMTNRYFYEPKPGYVSHTVGSKLLLNPQIADTIGYVTEETFPGAGRIATTTERFGKSEERNASCWNTAHDTDLPMFEYFETNPKRMTRFLGHMESLGGTEGYSIKHLVSGFDWNSVSGTVVDVGGSTGHASFAIAEVAPKLKFVVQDLENVVVGAKERSKSREKGDRVDFQVNDFFESQPVKQAEVYLLRFILHDYPDKYSAKILEHVVAAMGPESRIIIMDGIIPDPGVLPKHEDRKLR